MHWVICSSCMAFLARRGDSVSSICDSPSLWMNSMSSSRLRVLKPVQFFSLQISLSCFTVRFDRSKSLLISPLMQASVCCSRISICMLRGRRVKTAEFSIASSALKPLCSARASMMARMFSEVSLLMVVMVVGGC